LDSAEPCHGYASGDIGPDTFFKRRGDVLVEMVEIVGMVAAVDVRVIPLSSSDRTLDTRHFLSLYIIYRLFWQKSLVVFRFFFIFISFFSKSIQPGVFRSANGRPIYVPKIAPDAPPGLLSPSTAQESSLVLQTPYKRSQTPSWGKASLALGGNREANIGEGPGKFRTVHLGCWLE
jgi:hypothetical protein